MAGELGSADTARGPRGFALKFYTGYGSHTFIRPHTAVHSCNRDGSVRQVNPGDPVYAPNSAGGPAADPSGRGTVISVAITIIAVDQR